MKGAPSLVLAALLLLPLGARPAGASNEQPADFVALTADDSALGRAIALRNVGLLEEAVASLDCASLSSRDVRVALGAWRARAAGTEPLLHLPRAEAGLANCLAQAYGFGAQDAVCPAELNGVLRTRVGDDDTWTSQAAIGGLVQVGERADFDAVVDVARRHPAVAPRALRELASVCNPEARRAAVRIISLARTARERLELAAQYDPDRTYCPGRRGSEVGR